MLRLLRVADPDLVVSLHRTVLVEVMFPRLAGVHLLAAGSVGLQLNKVVGLGLAERRFLDFAGDGRLADG